MFGKQERINLALMRLEGIMSDLIGFTQKPSVKVRLLQRADKTHYWEVSVRSKKYPRLLSKGIWEWARNDQAHEVGILAGAMAEQLAAKYKDTRMDPDSCYHDARRIYKAIRARNNQLYGMGDELPRSADKVIASRVARNR